MSDAVGAGGWDVDSGVVVDDGDGRVEEDVGFGAHAVSKPAQPQALDVPDPSTNRRLASAGSTASVSWRPISMTAPRRTAKDRDGDEGRRSGRREGDSASTQRASATTAGEVNPLVPRAARRRLGLRSRCGADTDAVDPVEFLPADPTIASGDHDHDAGQRLWARSRRTDSYPASNADRTIVATRDTPATSSARP